MSHLPENGICIRDEIDLDNAGNLIRFSTEETYFLTVK
jgi:hypothetical protein